jgi:predicted ATPase/DNA-binding winged helix-turn-helix (wHTH) protein
LGRIYEIGPFRLDAEIGALTRAGMPVMLGARAVAVLMLLVERAQEFVSKSRLIDTAWPGVIVEESNLAVQIHAIRRVLAQAPGGQHWIETLAKRGYRFVGPVIDCAAVGPNPQEATRSNLPETPTPFVGRERDLVEIKRLLATRRLITIVGTGGIGKTRLALQAAAEVIGAYRDGIWFVDLASVREASLVPTTVAQALGVRERTDAPLIAALRQHLHARQLLLIVDNCEHLLGACAEVVDAVLKAASQTTIVATSREPLRAAGEQVYPLPPLSLPEADATVDALQRSDAVQLFVERLRQQVPTFAFTADRAPAIAELCIHLDGIPLALELAAARARSLTIEQINARLAQRFRLLTSGPRTALPRQQTLRATLDWSYDLLDDGERGVLRRVAIFSGSFTLEAACAVASDTTIDEFAVVDLLSQLVSRSLLIADTSTGAARYRLLETTRAYAHEKLVEADEHSVVARRYAECFDKLFERAPDDFLRLTDARLREIYVPELEHVRAALDWSFASEGDAAIGIRLAGNSGPLWGTLGLFSEGARRAEMALAHVRPDTPMRDEALLCRQLGRLIDETPARALPPFERAAALYRRIGDRLGLGHTLILLGRTLAKLGKFEDSRSALHEAGALLEDTELPWLRGLYYFNQGFLNSISGDPAGARINYERSRALFLEAGDDYTAAAAQANLANISWTLGDLDATETSFRGQVAFSRTSPMKTKRMLGWSLASLAAVLIERGRIDEALVPGREGLQLLLEDGSAWVFVNHFALRAALAGRLADAARLAGYADYAWSKQETMHHPVDARSQERLDSILRQQLPANDLERLRAEGAALSETAACRLALES